MMSDMKPQDDAEKRNAAARAFWGALVEALHLRRAVAWLNERLSR